MRYGAAILSKSDDMLTPFCMFCVTSVWESHRADPDLSVLGVGGRGGGSDWARGQGGLGGGSGGWSLRRKTIFCVSDAVRAISFIAFCEFLAVFLVLKTNNLTH